MHRNSSNFCFFIRNLPRGPVPKPQYCQPHITPPHQPRLHFTSINSLSPTHFSPSTNPFLSAHSSYSKSNNPSGATPQCPTTINTAVVEAEATVSVKAGGTAAKAEEAMAAAEEEAATTTTAKAATAADASSTAATMTTAAGVKSNPRTEDATNTAVVEEAATNTAAAPATA